MPQEPAEPIKKENKAEFEYVRDRIIAELNDTATDDMIITNLDSIVMPAAIETAAAADQNGAEK